MFSDTAALIQGAMYRVRIKIPGVFNVPRESCMKLFAIEGDTLFFSARPRLGTQEVQLKDIIELEIQPPDAKVYVSWKITSRRPPEKWDYVR